MHYVDGDSLAVHAGREDLEGLGVHALPIDLSTTNPLPGIDLGGDSYEALATGGRPLDGHSLRPLLADPKTMKWDGPEGVPSTVFAGEAAKTKLGSGEQQNPAKQHWSIRTIRWRYVRYNNGLEELYDHDTDAHEWTNLADRPQCAGTLESFRTQMAAWMRKSQDSKN